MAKEEEIKRAKEDEKSRMLDEIEEMNNQDDHVVEEGGRVQMSHEMEMIDESEEQEISQPQTPSQRSEEYNAEESRQIAEPREDKNEVNDINRDADECKPEILA